MAKENASTFTKEELALGERLFNSQPDSPWTAFCELRELFGSMSLERRQALYDIVAAQIDRQRAMFGCTAAAIDEALDGKSPRDVAMYAMGTLSNAQELFQRTEYEGDIEWTVPGRHANTIRQLMNVAKYAIDKAVPR